MVIANTIEHTGNNISGANANNLSSVKFFVKLVIIYNGKEIEVTNLAISLLLPPSNHFFIA